MRKLIDLAGKKFGRLTVIEREEDYVTPGGQRFPRWLCRCDCGRDCVVIGRDLKNGNTKSCGCLQREKTRESNQTHGKSYARLYRIWTAMKQRCFNSNCDSYHYYGGRGIAVCDEWKQSFKPFYDWAMENGYRDGLSIDRKDNEKGYCPTNCQWVTLKEQQNNKRNNHYITFNGKTYTIAEWSEIIGIDKGIIRDRLRRGWSVEQVLTMENKQQMESK